MPIGASAMLSSKLVKKAVLKYFMNNPLESHTVRRVMVGTDRSVRADQAVHWAAGFANRYGAELFVVQVVVPQFPPATELG